MHPGHIQGPGKRAILAASICAHRKCHQPLQMHRSLLAHSSMPGLPVGFSHPQYLRSAALRFLFSCPACFYAGAAALPVITCLNSCNLARLAALASSFSAAAASLASLRAHFLAAGWATQASSSRHTRDEPVHDMPPYASRESQSCWG
jgi:hypothetical protein